MWYIAEKHEIHSFIFCYINNNFFNPARVKYNSAYVVNPISALINIKYYFAQIEPSAKRLFELWGQPEELEMKLCEMKPEKIYQDRDMVFEVKNLVFGYEPGHPILNGISLCVKKGERIAIVGENGSGKSTLLNLLAGFYRPQKVFVGTVSAW